jgi:hypothetical protein
MVACTFVLLPLQTSKFIELYSKRDPFAATFHAHADAPHLVLFGHAGAPTIRFVRAHLLDGGLNEEHRLLNSAHRWHAYAVRSLQASLRRLTLWIVSLRTGEQHAQHAGATPVDADLEYALHARASVLVVLSPSPPDARVRQLLLEQSSPRWLYWLVGSALSPADLARAGVEHAAAALVAHDEIVVGGVGGGVGGGAGGVTDGDTRALLDALSLRYRQPALPCVVRLARHAQARQLRLVGTHAILEDAPLTQALLGLSATCPAVGTLLLLLLRPNTRADEPSAAPTPHPADGLDESAPCDNGLRLLQQPVPTCLVGMRPRAAVCHAYATAGVLLVARRSRVIAPPPPAHPADQPWTRKDAQKDTAPVAVTPLLLTWQVRTPSAPANPHLTVGLDRTSTPPWIKPPHHSDQASTQPLALIKPLHTPLALFESPHHHGP